MFKKLVIKEEFKNQLIKFPTPIDKGQHTGSSTTQEVVYYNGNPRDLYIGTSGCFGAMVRPFLQSEMITLSKEFLKYFDVVDYELTDEDVELAKEKVKSENTPLGNFLLSLLDVAEELLDVLEDEEQEESLFYIKLPRLDDSNAFLNYDSDDDKYTFASSLQIGGYRTQFTQNEIDELFPEFEQFKVEVSE